MSNENFRSKAKSIKRSHEKDWDAGVGNGQAPKVKATIIEYVKNGYSIAQALRDCGYSQQTYSYYRRADPNFRETMDRLMQAKKQGGIKDARGEKKDLAFEDFCEVYLDTKLFRHQLQWVDLIEGREPRELHENQVYEQGSPEAILVNTPPEHSLSLDMPILSQRGWITVGELVDGDSLFGPEGGLHEILKIWEPGEDVDLYEVEFGTGDVITTDGDHKWVVQRSKGHKPKQMTTKDILGDLKSPSGQLKWRVRQAAPIHLPDADLFDPYLYGYWLGDGDKSDSRFAVGDEDIAAFEDHFGKSYEMSKRRDSRGRSWVVRIKGIRKNLNLGMVRIPAEYFLGSHDQRMELLKGLMDSDGTISAKDGRARWVQHNREDLCRDVYRLIASLGFQPRWKKYGVANEISFKPDDEPVFRLERKAAKQFTRGKNRCTDFRTIKDVRPAGRGKVRCLTVLSDSNEYLAGDALIPTRNAKSTTLTVNYVTYKICQDPNIRIIIVSKTQEMAKRFLRAVKDRLSGTNPAYLKLQMEFAPEGGFSANSAAWTADSIYLSSELRDSGEPSPTVQALGIKGQIYGSRADIILMDDCVDSGNAHDFDKQIDWIQNEVFSRLAYPGGVLFLVGTRLAPTDLYSEIRKAEYYGDEQSPWTYLSQPAVLSFAQDPKDWVTLWPRTNRPPVSISARSKVLKDEDGLYPMWPGEALHKKRAKMSPRNWSMVYMQEQVADDAIFTAEKVVGCMDGQRQPGPMTRTGLGHRKNGMDGLYVIGGFDPAMTGHAAAVVMGVDRESGVRWVLDVWTKAHLKPDDLRDKIKEWTVRYRINEWRIEKNAMNMMLSQDREINQYLASRGCLLREHFTGSNKWDTNFGVASLSSLFEGHKEGNNLIRLPSRAGCEGVKALIEQLCTWFPDTKGKTDCVMALWFAEIRARELVDEVGFQITHMENKYASPRDKEKQMTVDLDYMANRQMSGVGVQGWMRLT